MTAAAIGGRRVIADDFANCLSMVGGFPHLLFGMTLLAGLEAGMIGNFPFFFSKNIGKEAGGQNADNASESENCVSYVLFMHEWRLLGFDRL
jgi:hypothetical protein